MILKLLGVVICVLTNAKIIVLNDKNFDHDTQLGRENTTGPWFILFHSPQCAYCQQVLPIWEQLSDELEDSVNVATIDGKENYKLLTRFGINRFPTFQYFDRGYMHTYAGKRTLNNFKNFVISDHLKSDKKVIPPPQTLAGKIKQEIKDIHTQIVFLALSSPKATMYTVLLTASSTMLAVLALMITFRGFNKVKNLFRRKKND